MVTVFRSPSISGTPSKRLVWVSCPIGQNWPPKTSMGHGEVEDQSTRRRQTVSLFLGVLQDYVVLYLNITPFFTSRWRNFVDLNSVTYRTKKYTQLYTTPSWTCESDDLVWPVYRWSPNKRVSTLIRISFNIFWTLLFRVLNINFNRSVFLGFHCIIKSERSTGLQRRLHS